MACCCLGPQNGEPLCPCQMSAARCALGVGQPLKPFVPIKSRWDDLGISEAQWKSIWNSFDPNTPNAVINWWAFGQSKWAR